MRNYPAPEWLPARRRMLLPSPTAALRRRLSIEVISFSILSMREFAGHTSSVARRNGRASFRTRIARLKLPSGQRMHDADVGRARRLPCLFQNSTNLEPRRVGVAREAVASKLPPGPIVQFRNRDRSCARTNGEFRILNPNLM